MKRLSGFVPIIGGFVVLALVVALLLAVTGEGPQKKLTAAFPRTVSLYEGSDVRVLGVAVGKVESVEPAGTTVKVTMAYDSEVKIPADAKAVIVSPSVVGDRFVQLTPVYTEGPVLEDGADLDVQSTADPLELDEIYQGIDDLLVALGPQGANKEGALSNLLDTTARNFAGQGEQFNRTFRNLGKLTATLDRNKDEFFGSLTEVQRFVAVLAENDATVRRFNDSLAQAADLLESERADLAAALRNLGTAMVQVRGFVKDNKAALGRNIKGLNRVTKILVKQRGALDEILAKAPLALNNLYLTYNPRSGTLDTRSNIQEGNELLFEDPAAFFCAILRNQPGGDESCNQLEDALPAPRAGAGEAKLRQSAQYGDPTLAGILGGTR